jgi:hypothetical protein
LSGLATAISVASGRSAGDIAAASIDERQSAR